jgi:hypothetical protein
VGERFGALVVETVRPTTFRCDCGKVVEKRMPYAVYTSKHPSCGCKRVAYKSEKRTNSPNYELVGLANDADKVTYMRWRVRCRKCGAELTVSNGQLLVSRKNRYGCRICLMG